MTARTASYNRTVPVDIRHILAADGAVARRLEGYESRPQQLRMAEAVERAMARKERLLVEAGTGVGKSFAYLAPAIGRIVDHRERVVVVTHTIYLQEQLIEKDIPLLNAVIPEEFTAVLVKGRGNYLSLRRLKLASERQDRLFTNDDLRHSLHVIENWAYGTRDGTLSTLPAAPRWDVWDHVQSDSHNCMGKKCPTYSKCFYQQARRRMENADLLVCNHALFFSDLALRAAGVSFLPPYHHVVLDEAHAVEDVAAEHFGMSLGESRVRHLMNMLYQPRTGKGFLAAFHTKDGSTSDTDDAIRLTLSCRDAADAFFSALTLWRDAHAPSNGRIHAPDIIENTLSPAMKSLADRLKLLKGSARNEADEFELASYSQRAHEIALLAENLLSQSTPGCVYWLDGPPSQAPRPVSRSRRTPRDARATDEHGSPPPSDRRTSAPRSITLKCVAVDVAPILKQHLFGREISVVLTSATLATGHTDFSHIQRRLGCEDARTLQVGSPFDHASQMKVIVERALPEPSDPSYIDRVVPCIARHVTSTDGGAFVLFTSFDMLRKVARSLRPMLAGNDIPVLVHGEDGPPSLLLQRFKMDERSVLLGTASFWQGVDVRGRGLRNVVITRLPFDVPDRPLIEARHELIRNEGGNPFTDDQLPRAIIRFKQGVGRLIRSTTDSGIVVILDPRVLTKPYGRLFLDALPEGVKVNTPDDDHPDEFFPDY